MARLLLTNAETRCRRPLIPFRGTQTAGLRVATHDRTKNPAPMAERPSNAQSLCRCSACWMARRSLQGPADREDVLFRTEPGRKDCSGAAAITRGSKNVFEDLGYPDAAERQAKLRLACALNQVLEDRQLSQADAAKVLGVTQPKVSALRHYKLAGFSVERLMNLLTALDRDVEIVIRRKPRSRKAGRISVVAA
jgi:predicted XRE-type DNA-binding protein